MQTPENTAEAPFFGIPLTFKNFRVMEFCTHTRQNEDCRGTMFLEDYMIYYIHKGKNVFEYGKQTYEVKAGELIVLPKATHITYNKSSDESDEFQYQAIFFFLKDEFVTDFLKMSNTKLTTSNEPLPIKVMPVKARLMRFFESLLPYFNEPDQIEEGLVRLKMLELMFDLSHLDKTFLTQVLQLRNQPVKDLSYVLEANYTNQLSVNDLASLSGRSLSTFKREFQQIYNTSPAQWIREKRLSKAKELLTTTNMSVTDVCFTTGFENIAHFSRAFKTFFGTSPSFLKAS